MEQDRREVSFFEYCGKCKHLEVGGAIAPCNECLDNPTNLYTDKPINYEKKDRE